MRKDLPEIKARLLEIREELRAEAAVKIETDTRPGGIGKVDDDAAPLSEMNQVIASNRNRERAERLRRIGEALDRMAREPEEFGICEDCDEEIPKARMLLMPWARMCIACQEAADDDGPRNRKNLRDYD